MLLVIDRHTPADLAKWEEYEEIDQINSENPRFEKKIEKSAGCLREFAEEGGYIGVSWGKDSVVVADLALRHGIDLPIVHLRCIPSHNTYCDLVRDKFLEIWPKADYHEVICDYGEIYKQHMAPCEQDKATDKVWYASWDKVGKMFGDRHVSGVRGAESAIRHIRMQRWGTTTGKTCAPIGYWSTADVFAYLYKFSLPEHPNYGMLGGGRWDRENLRTAEVGDIHGEEMGRTAWEREYYGDWLNRLAVESEQVVGDYANG